MATVATISASIREGMGDFLLASECCRTCSHEELIQQLFSNDIDTILNINTADGLWTKVSGYRLTPEIEDISDDLRDQMGTFLLNSHCCQTCSQLELKKQLFNNDIDTILNYTNEARLTEEESVVQLLIDTSSPVAMPNIHMGTSFDLFIENTIIGNTDLVDKLAALGNRTLAYPTGAILQWQHYKVSGGDQWNAIESDAVFQGKNFQTEQQGDMYNGGVPYGHDFFNDDFCYLISQPQMQVQRVIIGINIIIPLIPYSSALIDWANINIRALLDEIDIMIAKIAATPATIWLVELGMELRTNQYNTVLANPGGVENTKGKVLKKLLTHTNASSPISITDYLRQELPDVIISMDNKLWDDGAAAQADFNSQVMSIPEVNVGRQYLQFNDDDAASYAACRAHLESTRTDFWAFINGADFAGKGVFLSQFTVKQNSPVRNKVANGLFVAEVYMIYSQDNLLHDNKLVGMIHQNAKQLFDVGDNYSIRPHYHFVAMLGEYFDSTQELVSIEGSDSTVNDNLVMQATKVGSHVRVLIVNPTATEVAIGSISLDGTEVDTDNYSVKQRYCDDPVDPLTELSTEEQGTSLTIRPYSLSLIIVFNPNP